MSHFAVLVISKKKNEVDDLLAPFDENLEVESYVRTTREELLEEAKEMRETLSKKTAEEKANFLSWQKAICNAITDEQLLDAYCEESDKFDEQGNLLSTYNPNTQWDWYVVGGRWNNYLKTKNGQNVNSCKLKDIDFTSDSKAYEEYKRFWELVVEHVPLKDGEEKPFNFETEEYYKDTYKTKENFAKLNSMFSTYAILTPDGVWHAPGKIGWWGMSTESGNEWVDWITTYENFLKEQNQEYTATIVDCHI